LLVTCKGFIPQQVSIIEQHPFKVLYKKAQPITRHRCITKISFRYKQAKKQTPNLWEVASILANDFTMKKYLLLLLFSAVVCLLKAQAPDSIPTIHVGKIVDTSAVFRFVEESPIFPEPADYRSARISHQCVSAMQWYLNKQYNGYPAGARARGLQGRVVLSFVVRADSSVTDIQIVRNSTPDNTIPDAVIQAVRNMNNMQPKWTPGKQNGVDVAVLMTITIVFKLG
jgi:TonB family protein